MLQKTKIKGGLLCAVHVKETIILLRRLPILRENRILEILMKLYWQTVLPGLKDSRAIRYFSVNDFSREERNKKEEQMKKLKNDLDMYNRWMEELRSENS